MRGCESCKIVYGCEHARPSGGYCCHPCDEHDPDRLRAALEDAIITVRSGSLSSIGSLHNTYSPQIDVSTVKRWEEALRPSEDRGQRHDA